VFTGVAYFYQQPLSGQGSSNNNLTRLGCANAVAILIQCGDQNLKFLPFANPGLYRLFGYYFHSLKLTAAMLQSQSIFHWSMVCIEYTEHIEMS
jgi:hypothetical protein